MILMQAMIPEEGSSPKSLLRRSSNDLSPVKENSGYRSSPRGSPTRPDNSSSSSPTSDKAGFHTPHPKTI